MGELFASRSCAVKQADAVKERWVIAGESHGGAIVSNVDKGWWNARAWDVYITGTPVQSCTDQCRW